MIHPEDDHARIVHKFGPPPGAYIGVGGYTVCGRPTTFMREVTEGEVWESSFCLRCFPLVLDTD